MEAASPMGVSAIVNEAAPLTYGASPRAAVKRRHPVVFRAAGSGRVRKPKAGPIQACGRGGRK